MLTGCSTTLLQPVLNNREQVDDSLRQPDDFYACTKSSLDEKSVTRFLLRITAAIVVRGGGGECLYTLAGIKIPASAQITFKYFLKNWLYRVYTYLFFKHMPQFFAPKQRRQFEIFRKGDGLSLVYLLGIKAVALKS